MLIKRLWLLTLVVCLMGAAQDGSAQGTQVAGTAYPRLAMTAPVTPLFPTVKECFDFAVEYDDFISEILLRLSTCSKENPPVLNRLRVVPTCYRALGESGRGACLEMPACYDLGEQYWSAKEIMYSQVAECRERAEETALLERRELSTTGQRQLRELQEAIAQLARIIITEPIRRRVASRSLEGVQRITENVLDDYLKAMREVIAAASTLPTPSATSVVPVVVRHQTSGSEEGASEANLPLQQEPLSWDQFDRLRREYANRECGPLGYQFDPELSICHEDTQRRYGLENWVNLSEEGQALYSRSTDIVTRLMPVWAGPDGLKTSVQLTCVGKEGWKSDFLILPGGKASHNGCDKTWYLTDGSLFGLPNEVVVRLESPFDAREGCAGSTDISFWGRNDRAYYEYQCH